MSASLPIEVEGRGQLLGMSPADFLRDYWQQRPLLIRGALPGFESPLSPNDLAGLAMESDALSRLIRWEPRRDRWHLENGPIAAERYASLPKRHWTLLVQDVDKWDPEVRALLGHFDFLPAWRLDDIMISYAVPGGSVGAHIDQYDVFLLQGLGTRRWQIDARPQVEPALRDDAPIKLLQRFKATHEWLLQPGDMLYLPPAIAHHGVAESECLTLSVGMRAPSLGELLVGYADEHARRLPDWRRYGDSGLAPSADPYEIDAAALTRVRAALSAAAQAEDAELAEWFGRYITSYRSAFAAREGARLPRAADIAARFAKGQQLIADPWARRAWSARGRGAWLCIAGAALPCSRKLARAISAQGRIDAALYAAMSEDERAFVPSLIAAGAFHWGRA